MGGGHHVLKYGASLDTPIATVIAEAIGADLETAIYSGKKLRGLFINLCG